MDNKHGSRIVPIIFGIIEIILGIIIAGRGNGFIRYLTSFIGGGLFIFGLYSLYLGIFSKQEKVDEMTGMNELPKEDYKPVNIPTENIKIKKSNRHNYDFSDEVLNSIHKIQDTFQEVYPKSFEEWVDGFDRDANPAREIAVWELMAETYKKSLNSFSSDIETKKEIFKVLLLCSSGKKLEGIIKEINSNYLKEKDVILIINNYYQKNNN